MKKLKKIIATIASTAIAAASLSSLLITSASTPTTYNNTFRLYFDVSAGSGIKSYNGAIAYKKDSVFIGDFKQGNMGGSFSIAGTTGQNYTTGIGMVNFSAPTVSQGTLYTMTLYGCWTAPILDGTMAFVNFNEAYNSSGTIMNPNPVTITEILVGDPSQNGVVDIGDFLVLTGYLNGTRTLTANALRSADTNNDGLVTSADTDLIMQYLGRNLSHFE
jgi:hypothetical protein